MRIFRSGLAVAALSGAALAGGFFGGGTLLDHVQFARAESQVESSRHELTHIEDISSVFRDVAKVVEPSVVKIEVTKTIKVNHPNFDNDLLRKFFRDNGQDMPAPPEGEQDFQQDGTGSGVIMETGGGYGYILTNNHVAGGASDIRITLADGRIIEHGHLLGADPKSDLAVVRIKEDDLIPARWGNSDDLQKGDWILAFGSPLGYAGSMTHGIVSALNRNDVGIIQHGYEHFIQVDAPINPGNSGGPLVNLHGEVVGINTAIASQTGTFSGIGFAIPSNQAQKIFETLKTTGKVVRGWLGVYISNVSDNPPLAQSFGYDKKTGILIQDPLPNTPAYGKLIGGDIITAYNGQPVNDVDALRNAVAATAPGTTVKMTIFRDNHALDVSVTIGNQPADEPLASSGGARSAPGDDNAKETRPLPLDGYGMEIENLNDETAQKLGLDAGTTGAVITNVKPNSVAAKAGLRPGLVITHVGRTEVTTARQAYNALSRADLKKGVRLTLTQQAGSQFVFVQEADDSPSNN